MAAVQVPYYSPYRKPTLDSRSSGRGDINSSTGAKAHFQGPLELRPATPSKPHRWSQNSSQSECIVEEQQMSNHGTASGLPLREGNNKKSSTSISQTPSEHAPVTTRSFELQAKMDGLPAQGYDLPSSHRSPEGTSEADRRSSRSFGVHSILNPSHGEEGERPPRQRNTNQSEEYPRIEMYPPGSLGSSSRPPSDSVGGKDERSPPAASGVPGFRRILTPISPRQLHRAPSFSRIVTGTIDATEQPFLSPSSRIHTQEPGTGGVPPLPAVHSSHAAQRSPFTAPTAPTPPLVPLGGPRRASMSVVHSARASPSPSYSSYSQSGHASPAHAYYPSGSGTGSTPPGSYRLAPSPVVGSLSNVPPVSLEGEQQGYGIPVVSSGQNYQLLTIDTTRGQTQLPVEVQAASRVADEKRKRNAGASARFRARRKEKEREASSRISNLEQDLAFAREDSEYYKRERDYLVDIFVRTVPHFEGYLRDRPHSPRIGRVRHVSEPLSSMGEDSPAPSSVVPISRERIQQIERLEHMEQYEQRMEGERPTQRRRTETFPAGSPTGLPPFGASPFPPFMAPPTVPQSQQSQPHPGAQYSSRASGSIPPQTAPRPPSSLDQYRMEQSYDRSWPPARSGPPR